jgi:hypothetical protein
VPAEAGDGPTQIELRQIFELSDFPVAEHESGWREEEEQIRAAPPPAPSGERTQRYILFFQADARSERGELPAEEELAGMGEVIADMHRQGVLLGCEGLQPSAKGARIYFEGGKRTVVDGPFTEAKELIAGYTLIQVASRDEAIEWSKRGLLSFPVDGENLIMRVSTEADFAEMVAQVPEVFERERALRERLITA